MPELLRFFLSAHILRYIFPTMILDPNRCPARENTQDERPVATFFGIVDNSTRYIDKQGERFSCQTLDFDIAHEARPARQTHRKVPADLFKPTGTSHPTEI